MSYSETRLWDKVWIQYTFACEQPLVTAKDRTLWLFVPANHQICSYPRLAEALSGMTVTQIRTLLTRLNTDT